jgi:hypothetical protein
MILNDYKDKLKKMISSINELSIKYSRRSRDIDRSKIKDSPKKISRGAKTK